MKPISLIFSRERTVAGEKIGLGIQAEITEGESTDNALTSLQALVEQKLSALAPSPEEQQRREREQQAVEKRQQIEAEYEARRQELANEYGDVLSAPVVESTPPTEAPTENPA